MIPMFPVAFGNGGTPSPIPTANLVLWLDATAITGHVNNDPVTTWEDLSPVGNDAANGNVAEQPIYSTNVFNGGTMPGVNFNNIFKNLICPHVADYDFAQMSIYVVGQLVCGSGNCWLLGHQPLNPAGGAIWVIGGLCPLPDTWYAFLTNGGGGVSSPNSVVNASVPHIFSYIYNGATLKSYLDTVADGSVANAGSIVTNTGDIVINHVTSSGTTEEGRSIIGEIILYSGAQSDADRDIVHNYLKAKWGF